MNSSRTIRVFQVATGNLGTEMIGRITSHPDLELVGLHCYTPDKIGRDVGEIVGIDAWGSRPPVRSRRSSQHGRTS